MKHFQDQGNFQDKENFQNSQMGFPKRKILSISSRASANFAFLRGHSARFQAYQGNFGKRNMTDPTDLNCEPTGLLT